MNRLEQFLKTLSKDNYKAIIDLFLIMEQYHLSINDVIEKINEYQEA